MKFLVVLMLFSTNLFADSAPKLDQLSQDDVTAISKEFASNFTHTILAPASSLGKIWGFELGIMGGMTKTPEINRVSKKISANSDVDSMPTAGIISSLTLPYGINAELNIIPKIKASDVSLENISYAIKWEMSRLISNSPVDVAIRVHGNTGELEYKSIINNASTSNQNVNATTTWKNSSTGYNLEISKKLLFIEPYVGIGRVSAETDLNVTGSSNISIFTFSNSSSYKASNSGSHYFVGLNLNLLFIKIGAEYNHIMGNKKTVAKLTLYF